MSNQDDIAQLRKACYARLDYGKSRGVEPKVWLKANRVLDALYSLEQQRDELFEALEALEALTDNGNESLHPVRKRARAALAKARGE